MNNHQKFINLVHTATLMILVTIIFFAPEFRKCA